MAPLLSPGRLVKILSPFSNKPNKRGEAGEVASVNVPSFLGEVGETLGDLGNAAFEGLEDVSPF
jgi:hypothetical protein